mmetsp:Transcript_15969/g.31800  ORF Transcript_15969/g.31800 Transcript_15969/m.31800 type:complete len:246 (-) Transcript_15969:216-953(-)
MGPASYTRGARHSNLGRFVYLRKQRQCGYHYVHTWGCAIYMMEQLHGFSAFGVAKTSSSAVTMFLVRIAFLSTTISMSFGVEKTSSLAVTPFLVRGSFLSASASMSTTDPSFFTSSLFVSFLRTMYPRIRTISSSLSFTATLTHPMFFTRRSRIIPPDAPSSHSTTRAPSSVKDSKTTPLPSTTRVDRCDILISFGLGKFFFRSATEDAKAGLRTIRASSVIVTPEYIDCAPASTAHPIERIKAT